MKGAWRKIAFLLVLLLVSSCGGGSSDSNYDNSYIPNSCEAYPMGEVRKIGVEDIAWADFTSTGGVSVTGVTPESIPHALGPYIDVRAYGATGDGSTDDTTYIQDAIDAASAGDVICFPVPSSYYKITSAVNIDKSLTIIGFQSEIRQATSNTAGLYVTADNVTIRGLHLVGPQYAASQASGRAIFAEGSAYNSYISGFKVINNRIDTWGANAVTMRFVQDFDISHNYMNNLYYAGVLTYSATQGVISKNIIDTIVGTPLAYGITLNRDELDSLTTAPRSADIDVSGNVVTNVPYWEGLDTHGGQRINFDHNEIYGVKIGINIGASDDSGNNETFAPLDVNVSNNIIDSGSSSGDKFYAVSFTGALGSVGSSTQKGTGSIKGNMIRGYGDEDDNISAAIYIRDTQGIDVVSNIIVEPSPFGIEFYHDNYGFNCVGNAIVDPWSNSVDFVSGIEVRSGYNTGHVGGNSISTDSKSATYVLVNAVRVEDQTGNDVSVGINYSDASTLLYDNGSKANTTFQKFSIGSTGTTVNYMLWNATASVADGGSVTHGMGTNPTAVIAVGTVASEMVSVTSINSTTFTVGIKKDDGTAGTTQTIYWLALK